MKRNVAKFRARPRRHDTDAEGYFIDPFFDPGKAGAPCCFLCFAQDVPLSPVYDRDGAKVRACAPCAQLLASIDAEGGA